MDYNDLSTTLESLQKIVGDFGVALSSVVKSISPSIEAISKIGNMISGIFKDLDAFYSLEDIERYKIVSGELKKFGWTISFKNPYIKNLHEYILEYENKSISRDEYINKINTLLEKYVGEYDKDSLFEFFEVAPERTAILKAAYKLFDEGNFDLCIPIFLIQSDGITRDILHLNSKMSIYAKKEYERNIKQEIYKKFDKDFENIEDLTTRMIYANIAVFDSYSESLSASSSDIERLYDSEEIHSKFSRHTILHGIDNSYGCKLNAAKCLSIFSYLNDAFPILVMLYDAEEDRSNELN